MNTLVSNRKAKHDYVALENYSAGIQLVGSEVKVIRNGNVSLTDTFCYFRDNELFIKNLNIPTTSVFFGHEPSRDKKLLLSKRELKKLKSSLDKHLTIVPLYFFQNENRLIKCEIALCKGKKDYDKREHLKAKDAEREIKQYYK